MGSNGQGKAKSEREDTAVRVQGLGPPAGRQELHRNKKEAKVDEVSRFRTRRLSDLSEEQQEAFGEAERVLNGIGYGLMQTGRAEWVWAVVPADTPSLD